MSVRRAPADASAAFAASSTAVLVTDVTPIPPGASPSTSVPVASTIRRGSCIAKRTLDVVASGVLLVLLAPLFLVIVIAIVVDDPGPVFYVCRRAGHRGRPLRLVKFRKMHSAARGGPLTMSEDPRLTRVGRVLAKTKLDELPQLWCVFTGSMSLVGPRPEDPQFVALYHDAYDVILTTRPGITGLSQLAFAREADILDHDDPIGHYVQRLLPQKVDLDLLYVARRNMVMDLKILGWTAMTVLGRRPVAVDRERGRLGIRRRPNAHRQDTGGS